LLVEDSNWLSGKNQKKGIQKTTKIKKESKGKIIFLEKLDLRNNILKAKKRTKTNLRWRLRKSKQIYNAINNQKANESCWICTQSVGIILGDLSEG